MEVITLSRSSSVLYRKLPGMERQLVTLVKNEEVPLVFCLETQHFPVSPNQSAFPTTC
ncbi:MAG: hypothetical protein IPH28_08155 [Cytophagaceae bacterium]|nr:hypothetical protein [Cytophagaceae bacterium]